MWYLTGHNEISNCMNNARVVSISFCYMQARANSKLLLAGAFNITFMDSVIAIIFKGKIRKNIQLVIELDAQTISYIENYSILKPYWCIFWQSY